MGWMASSDFFRANALREHVWNVFVAGERTHVSARVDDKTRLFNAERLSAGGGVRRRLDRLLVLFEIRGPDQEHGGRPRPFQSHSEDSSRRGNIFTHNRSSGGADFVDGVSLALRGAQSALHVSLVSLNRSE